MRILITSGGTKVPLDPVRDITNMSKGTFGSKIAFAALDRGHKVNYFISEGGRTPFDYSCKVDNIDLDYEIATLKSKAAWADYVKGRYVQTNYRNYDDYAEGLPFLIKMWMPDVVVLAAAVSDYIATPSTSKIRSNEELTIQLEKADKVISTIKAAFPNVFLVGFKLVVGKTRDRLIEACQESLEVNGCDLVVGNDLVDLKNGRHNIAIVDKSGVSNFDIDMAQNLLCTIEEKCTTSSLA